MGACCHWELDWLYLPATSDLIVLELTASIRKGSTALELLLLAGFFSAKHLLPRLGKDVELRLYLRRDLYQGQQATLRAPCNETRRSYLLALHTEPTLPASVR